MDIIQQDNSKNGISLVLLFSLTLFSSASLMFVLQPMFGKALLPLLGGSASVWNTCMVFYQSVLFLGYLYAHLLATRLGFRQHIIIHTILLLLSISFLPVGIAENTHPSADDNPSIWLLSTLLLAIGLPFFILSTTSPLLQKWFSKIGHHTSQDPYYLSIASNTGSLVALLSYPLVLEPNLGISLQQQYWSVVFFLLCAMIVLCMSKLNPQHFLTSHRKQTLISEKQPPSLRTQSYWLLLAFVPSSLLLGTTNFISLDIATVPLLWVIPLALYLLSFILVFCNKAASIHKRMLLMQPIIVVPFLLYYFSNQKLASFTLELLLHLMVFFISIMVCHGELAKKRPATQHLTQYYLIMSFGGMLGGIFNSFIAPLIFSSIHEYSLMIVCALLLNPINNRIRLYFRVHMANIISVAYSVTFLVAIYISINQFSHAMIMLFAAITLLGTGYFFFRRRALYIPLMGLMIVSCTGPEKTNISEQLHQSRNFYGVLSVKERHIEKGQNRTDIIHEIYSGSTRHGLQLVNNDQLQCLPLGYYSPQGPLGSVFSNYAPADSGWNIGVIGLGAGGMAGYGKPGQNWTFFELDPAVVALANNPALFSYLNACNNNHTIAIGDARITLEQQISDFNLLVIDAFTSDSIPTHLLTREAIELYLSKLTDNGLLVFHISNRYLALKQVLADHAQTLGLELRVHEFRPENRDPLVYRSDWAVLARNERDLRPMLNADTAKNWQTVSYQQNFASWTDDFTSIMSVWK